LKVPQEIDLEDDLEEDSIVEIQNLFNCENGEDTELFIRVKWRINGIRDEPFHLVQEDAPISVESFLLQNEHLRELATIELEKHIPVTAVNEDENGNKQSSKTNKKPTVRANKECASALTEKTYHCTLDHCELTNLKIESRGAYFLPNMPYNGVSCEKCNVVLEHVSVRQPAYCCVHENHGCRRSVCFSCIKKIVQSGSKTPGARPRRTRG